MELVAPGGSPLKALTAFRFGARAVYFGFPGLSLRAKAENFEPTEPMAALELSRLGKLYCALNIVCKPSDIDYLEEIWPRLAAFPISAFIVSDPGLIHFIRRMTPKSDLHLSTQASCANAEAARFWRDLGFSRIVLARELTLKEIASIRRAVDKVELEVFAHGAMCLAYSGRCLLSAYYCGRSANSGQCAHSCRWEYREFEERQRQGSPLGIGQGEGFSMAFAPLDVCLIDRLAELRDAGVDAIKIEGRMKSEYYVAAVCQAYDQGLKRLSGQADDQWPEFRAELNRIPHRPYSNGFIFDSPNTPSPIDSEETVESRFIAMVDACLGQGRYLLAVKNSFDQETPLYSLSPGKPRQRLNVLYIQDSEGQTLTRATNQKPCIIGCEEALGLGSLIVD